MFNFTENLKTIQETSSNIKLLPWVAIKHLGIKVVHSLVRKH